MRRALHIYTCIYTHIHLLCTLAATISTLCYLVPLRYLYTRIRSYVHLSNSHLHPSANCWHPSATCMYPFLHPYAPTASHKQAPHTCNLRAYVCAGSGTATRAETAQYSARAHRAHPQNTVRRHGDAAAHVHLFVPVVQVGDLLHAQLDGGDDDGSAGTTEGTLCASVPPTRR
jgi:hypothetical protein